MSCNSTSIFIDLGKKMLLMLLFSLSKFKNYTHDTGKTVRRVPKKNRQAQECKDQRRSALNVRLFLREFCVDFLENCYNHLMYLVKVSCKSFVTYLLNKEIHLNLFLCLFHRKNLFGSRLRNMMRHITCGRSAFSWPSTVAMVSTLT